MTTLIADSGSTKTNWLLISNNGKIEKYQTEGINPVVGDSTLISNTIGKSFAPYVEGTKINKIIFYGAGCTSSKKGVVEKALYKFFPDAEIEVESDVLAAARALCGHNEGIACIMGTGSNSCYYDGVKIVDNVSPLGYILGDEGSGAVLGKLLVGDVLKNQLPAALCEKFLKQYGLDRQKIIESVYKKPAANRFLASLSPFLIENIEEPAVHRLVLNAFKAFFVRNIENYEGYKTMPVSFVGSVAYYYRDVLEEAASSLGIKVGTVIKSPMEGLVKYHSN